MAIVEPHNLISGKFYNIDANDFHGGKRRKILKFYNVKMKFVSLNNGIAKFDRENEQILIDFAHNDPTDGGLIYLDENYKRIDIIKGRGEECHMTIVVSFYEDEI